MTKIEWGKDVNPRNETGIDQGVLYVGSDAGVPWNGLVSIKQNPIGGELTARYLDGNQYVNSISAKEYQATLSTFSVPKEFMPCMGYRVISPGFILTKQPRLRFGLSYRTRVGTDGYKIHILYNVMATPSKRGYFTLSDDPKIDPIEWTLTAVPPPATTYKPTPHLVIDSTKTPLPKLTAVENLLYGTSTTAPAIPTQAAIISLLNG